MLSTHCCFRQINAHKLSYNLTEIPIINYILVYDFEIEIVHRSVIGLNMDFEHVHCDAHKSLLCTAQSRGKLIGTNKLIDYRHLGRETTFEKFQIYIRFFLLQFRMCAVVLMPNLITRLYNLDQKLAIKWNIPIAPQVALRPN